MLWHLIGIAVTVELYTKISGEEPRLIEVCCCAAMYLWVRFAILEGLIA